MAERLNNREHQRAPVARPIHKASSAGGSPITERGYWLKFGQ